MVDRWVGRLLERIESLGIWDDTAIIFTSDHGYYFGEHGLFGKTVTDFRRQEWYRSPLYQEITRVPLLIYVPGIKPRRTEALVSLPDLMPTVLELGGLEVTDDNIQGKSLVPILNGEDEAGRDHVITSFWMQNVGAETRIVDDVNRQVRELMPSTVTTKEWSLLYSTKGEAIELYNLKEDPQEKKNVAAIPENRTVVEALHGNLVQLLEQCGTDEEFLAPRRELE